MNKYINLITHSYYSFLQSTLSLEKIVNFAIENNNGYASLVDINTMHGSIEFFKLCKQKNIKPIIGLQINYDNSNLVFIAKNNLGYQSLLKISSTIMTDQILDINKYLNENIFLIKLCGNFIWNNNNFYTIDINSKNSIACCESFYYDENDYQTYLIIDAIKNEKQLDINEQYISNENMLFKKDDFINKFNKQQLDNLENLIKQINIDLDLIPKSNVISFPNPLNISSSQYLDKIATENLNKYLDDFKIQNKEKYYERLKLELNIIHEKQFDDYFLVVQDFINWAKKQKIIVGPGRGSSSGSLVSFCLNITEIDPIKYDLLFERFLNIERISMPDIDIDIMDSKREKVIDYLFNKYGNDHVSHIITFSKIKAKQSIRDIGRVFDINLNIINKICKNIKAEYEENLLEIIQNENQTDKNILALKQEYNSNKKLFEYSQKIINFPRQSSTHAAGIILSKLKITDLVAVQSTQNNKIMTQTSMEFLEEIGLIKIDLLGLRNLTIIDNIIKLVKYTKKIDIDLKSIDLNDQNVFKLFQNKMTEGIFQFESPGMKNTLMKIKPTSLEDLSITSALYRPGANTNINLFIKNKSNPNINYLNKDIKNILSSTFGIIIYQEQIIKLVQTIAKFDKFKADNFRKAISKKREDIILDIKQDFINGAISNGYSNEQANEQFENIILFANYGFNHSHSLAYSFISYWLAYLKYYYPIESISVFLTYGDSNKEKIYNYIDEAKRLNIKIQKPDINFSSTSFALFEDTILFSFTAIDSLGLESAKKIIEQRENQVDKKFKDAYVCIAQLSNIGINKNIIINLIKSGAFDRLEKNRDLLLENVNKLVDKSINVLDNNLNFIFDLNLNLNIPYNYEKYSQYELDSLGIEFSNSKLSLYYDQNKNKYNLSNISDKKENDIFNIAIKINSLTTKLTKFNKEFFIMNFEENKKTYSLLVFNELDKIRNIFENNELTIIKVKLKENEKIDMINIIKEG